MLLSVCSRINDIEHFHYGNLSVFMRFNQNKEYSLHKNTVLFPMDWCGTPIWPPFLCFGTPTWLL